MPVERARLCSEGVDTLMVQIGLPPGANIERESKARLLADGTVSRYEPQTDRIVSYTGSWRQEDIGFRFTPPPVPSMPKRPLLTCTTIDRAAKIRS